MDVLGRPNGPHLMNETIRTQRNLFMRQKKGNIHKNLAWPRWVFLLVRNAG